MESDYEDAFGYPLRGDGVVTRFLIGGGAPSLLTLAFLVLGVLSLFLAPAGVLFVLLFPAALAVGLALNGYYVSVVRETFAGNDEPPSFGDWKALLVDGGYCLLIALVYSLPLVAVAVVVTVVFAVLVGGGAAFGGSETESLFAALGIVSILVFTLLSLLAMVYSLAMGYLYPISVCIYADTGDVREAFSRKRLLPVARSGDYAVPWLIQMGVLFGVQMFVGMLTMVLIGYLLYPLLPFATFFVMTAAFYMFAKVYDGLVGAERTESTADGRSAVRKDSQSESGAGY